MERETITKFKGEKKIHWAVFPITTSIPVIWFNIIINIFGRKLNFIDSDNQYTLIGVILTILMVGCSVLVAIVKSRESYREMNKSIATAKGHESNAKLSEMVLSSADELCIQKYNTLITYIDTMMNTKNRQYVQVVTNPPRQITTIISKIAYCISQTTEIEESQLEICIAYSYPLNRVKWKWADGCCSNDLTVHKLENEKSSTFYQVSSGQESFVFYNDKAKAQEDGHYVMDKRDHSCGGVGSIICANVSVGTRDSTFVNAIIAIGSYGKKIVPSDNVNAIAASRKNIEQFLLNKIALRLKIELALQYIAYLEEKNRPGKTKNTKPHT